VLLLMAYMLPLSERSGVNLKGLHAPSHLLLDQDDALETPRPGDNTEGGPAESLYASFWGVQLAFADPTAAMAPDAWAVLVERLEAVLQGFANIVSTESSTEPAPAETAAADGATPAEAADTGGGGDPDGREAMEVEQEAEAMGKEVYFAKFLTSPKLLQLQLRDSYFRRHVLVTRNAPLRYRPRRAEHFLRVSATSGSQSHSQDPSWLLARFLGDDLLEWDRVCRDL
jgi:hypothetical protein